MDFIKNTQFRCTILTHKNTPISRNITQETLAKFNYYCNITPKDTNINLADNSTATFYIDNIQDKTMSSSDPNMKSVLMVLHNNLGNSLSIKELAIKAKKLVPSNSETAILQNIYTNFSTLIFRGYINFVEDKPKSVAKISKKPKVSELARLQIQKTHANNKFWVTTSLNQLMVLQSHQVDIVKSLDGTNTVDQIKAKTLDALINGKINASEGEQKIEDKKRLETIANTLVDNTLEDLRKNFILTA